MERTGLTKRFKSEYSSWKAMKRRCYCPADVSYKYVGAKGLTVCDEWRTSFAAFLRDMGPKPRPEFSIDRIDGNLGYFPGNCRWATKKEQARNRPSYNRLLYFRGERRSIAEWSELVGIPESTISARIDEFAWSVQDALTIQPILGQHPFLKPKPASSGTSSKNKTSGILGVTWNDRRNKWVAKIWFKGKHVFLGYHRSVEEAAAAVERKRAELLELVHG